MVSSSVAITIDAADCPFINLLQLVNLSVRPTYHKKICNTGVILQYVSPAVRKINIVNINYIIIMYLIMII